MNCTWVLHETVALRIEFILILHKWTKLMRFDHFSKRLADVRGFSIAEILVAIVVFGILAGIAVPQFVAFRPKNRLNGAARQVYSELMWARSKAVNDNSRSEEHTSELQSP